MAQNSKTPPQAGESLKNLTRFFKREKIDFCLIGGFALGFYGLGRFTKDIDFKIAVRPQHWPHLKEKFLQTKEVSDLKIHYISDPKVPDLIRYQWNRYPIDLLVANTDYQIEVIKRAKKFIFEDHPMKVASPEDLIILKLIAHRAQDLVDIQTILENIQPLNRRYISKWVKIWEVEKIWANFPSIKKKNQ